MKLPSLSFALFFSLVVQAYFPATAVAWGATGHRLINRLAARMFPPDLPAFVRTESGGTDTDTRENASVW